MVAEPQLIGRLFVPASKQQHATKSQASFRDVRFQRERAPKKGFGLSQLLSFGSDVEGDPARQDGRPRGGLCVGTRVLFTFTAAQKKNVRVVREDSSGAREMHRIVVVTVLHPGGGRPVPQAHHRVGSGRDGVEQHAGDFPMHGAPPELDLPPIGDVHEDSLRIGGRAGRERLDEVGAEHRGVRMQKRAAAQDVILVAADSRLGRGVRQPAQLRVELGQCLEFQAGRLGHDAGGRAREHLEPAKVVRSVGDSLRRALVQELNPEGRELWVARQLREDGPVNPECPQVAARPRTDQHHGIVAGSRLVVEDRFQPLLDSQDTAVFDIGGGRQVRGKCAP